MKSYIIINVINALFEKLIHNKKQFNDDEGIAFLCTIKAECLGYESDGNTRHDDWHGDSSAYIHVIILKRHEVYVHISKEFPSFGEFPQSGWANTSNHHSCWRDGCRSITTVGFSCWDEAHNTCPIKERPSTKSENLNFSLSFGCLGNIFKLVKVVKEDQGDGYHYNITKVEEIGCKLIK